MIRCGTSQLSAMTADSGFAQVESQTPKNELVMACGLAPFRRWRISLYIFYLQSKNPLVLWSVVYHRIIEWVGLKRSKKIMSFQPPDMGRDTFHCPRLLRGSSSLALNSSRNGAVTASLGYLCQVLTTLTAENFSKYLILLYCHSESILPCSVTIPSCQMSISSSTKSKGLSGSPLHQTLSLVLHAQTVSFLQRMKYTPQ